MLCPREAKIRTIATHTAAFIAMNGPYRLIEGIVRMMLDVTVEKGYTIVGMPVGVFTGIARLVPRA